MHIAKLRCRCICPRFVLVVYAGAEHAGFSSNFCIILQGTFHRGTLTVFIVPFVTSAYCTCSRSTLLLHIAWCNSSSSSSLFSFHHLFLFPQSDEARLQSASRNFFTFPANKLSISHDPVELKFNKSLARSAAVKAFSKADVTNPKTHTALKRKSEGKGKANAIFSLLSSAIALHDG